MKYKIYAVIILLLSIGLGFFIYSSERNPESNFPFHFGLDLSGGTHLTYSADVSQTEPSQIKEAMGALRDVIERRVNLFGVAEPIVQVEQGSVLGEESSGHRLIVELPGVTDVDRAIELIGITPTLEFKLLTGDSNVFNQIEEPTREDFDQLFSETGLTGRFLERAQLEFSSGQQGLAGEPVVTLHFNKEGEQLFAQITRDNVGEILAIFLDGQSISTPVINQEIPDGRAQISGDFTPEEARELVRNLNYGALPLPIELIGSQSIEASLGSQALSSGITAGVWGLIILSIFLILWYRLPGFVSMITLVIYVIVMFAIFKLIPVTLTVAGIAGFVMSIGMAVDANILIFERTKEEMKGGQGIKDSVGTGFKRAWLSIRDSNISSIITAVILFWLGTSSVQGFALVFGLGVLASMLTAVIISRTFLLAISPKEDGEFSKFMFSSGLK